MSGEDILSPSKKKILAKLYQDPHQPGSLGGVQALYEAARVVRPDISRKDVHRFLEDSRAYTLHKLQPKKFKRRSILSPKPRVILAADLADMRVLSRYNKGYNYILVCIDAFSRFAKALALRRKDAKSMVAAMKTMLERDDVFKGVTRLFVDRGREFYNASLLNFLESRHIKTYSVSSQETKSAIAERFIRSLKGRLYRYMTAHNTLEYVSILEGVIQSYNHTRHSRLGKTPAEVHAMRKPEEIMEQFKRIHHYKSQEKPRNTTSRQLNIGDYVRLVGADRASKFSRGFNIQNTEEIFKIDTVDHRQYPIAYTLKDLSNKPILGLFYREELVKVQLPEVFPIKIKRSRVVNGRKQFYVSWVGYDSSQDGWIDASDIS